MRAIHAVRELNEERADPIRLIALYTEPERHALFVRQSDEAHCLGPAMVQDGEQRRSAYLDYGLLERALSETQADAAWVGWGFVAEHPAFAELCERLGIVFVGPDPDVMRALGDKIESKKLAEQAGVPVAPWSGGPVESVEEAQRQGESARLPAHDQGRGGRRRARHAPGRGSRRASDRLRARPRRGRPGVRRSQRADGAPRRRRPARRGPAPGRRPGRGVGARRARLLLPAPPPEGGRGVGQPGSVRRAGARARGLRRPARPLGRLSRRGHRRVPLRAGERALLVHGGQRPAPGRAPGDRDGDRHRPRPPAAPHRRRRAPGGRAAAAARPRDRGPPQRRGSRARVRAGAGPHHAAAAADRAGRPCRQRLRRGRRGPGGLRLDDRQDHRPREHARAGDRAPAPRCRRHDGRARRGHHQPGLPARAAGPPGAAGRRGRHGLARPPPGAGRRGADASRRRRARAGGDRALRRGHSRRSRPLLRARPARAPACRVRRRPPGRPPAPRRELPHERLPDRPGPLPGRGRRRRGSRPRSRRSPRTSAGCATAGARTGR